MERRNTLVLSWDEVRTLVLDALHAHVEFKHIDEVTLEYTSSGLILGWDPSKQPQVSADEKLAPVPLCITFNEVCSPVLEILGLDGIPILWLEKFFYVTSFVARVQERNGQLHMPVKFGHELTGPLTCFDDFYQYLTTCLRDKWPVVDTSLSDVHSRIVSLSLWVGVNAIPLFASHREEFLSSIRALFEGSCG